MEAIPEKKFTSSFKTGGKAFSKDEKTVACDTYSKNSAVVDNETTGDHDETTDTNNSTLTDHGNIKSSVSNSPRTENSSSWSDEGQRKMWEDVASKYQEILHREYRMLNLPSYPVPGGNVYLYYVPVIINSQHVPQDYRVYNDSFKKSNAADETHGNEENVIYISDDNDDDYIPTVKNEPLDYDQPVENDSSFENHIKVEDNKERFPSENISCKKENKQCDSLKLLPCMEETLATIKVKKNSDDKNSCSERREDKQKNESKDDPQKNYDEQNVKHLRKDQYCSDNNVEVREGHIRIIKGYTIEYHPLHCGNKVSQWCDLSKLDSPQDRKRAEKIQDLKKRLAEQEEELEKLKLQQSTEDVSGKKNANGILFQQKFAENGIVSEFTVQKAWKFLKEFPSTQIHYFPSGERKTSPLRRSLRKQAVPRRVKTLANIADKKETDTVIKNAQMEVNINGEIKCSLAKRKRKLSASPELKKENLSDDKIDKRVLLRNNSPKRARPSKKVKVGRKNTKTRHVSQVSDQNLRKRSPTFFIKTREDLTYIENVGKATTPQDITQEKFLSMFGLLRMRGQQSAISKV